METIHVILLIVFVVTTLVGYKIINRVPSLLHTPLMSGMNAFSGVTVLGCLTATAVAVKSGNSVVGTIFGIIAIALAMVNVVGGFGVTDRMLRMFDKRKSKKNRKGA
mgnify:CR=1 FL=1